MALITLGIYMSVIISRALHSSPKVLEVSFSFTLILDYKIAPFLTFE